MLSQRLRQKSVAPEDGAQTLLTQAHNMSSSSRRPISALGTAPINQPPFIAPPGSETLLPPINSEDDEPSNSPARNEFPPLFPPVFNHPTSPRTPSSGAPTGDPSSNPAPSSSSGGPSGYGFTTSSNTSTPNLDHMINMFMTELRSMREELQKRSTSCSPKKSRIPVYGEFKVKARARPRTVARNDMTVCFVHLF